MHVDKPLGNVHVWCAAIGDDIPFQGGGTNGVLWLVILLETFPCIFRVGGILDKEQLVAGQGRNYAGEGLVICSHPWFSCPDSIFVFDDVAGGTYDGKDAVFIEARAFDVF